MFTHYRGLEQYDCCLKWAVLGLDTHIPCRALFFQKEKGAFCMPHKID